MRSNFVKGMLHDVTTFLPRIVFKENEGELIFYISSKSFSGQRRRKDESKFEDKQKTTKNKLTAHERKLHQGR